MNERLTGIDANAPDAIVREKKSFSIVWIVPIIAVIIGGWLVYKALSEKGEIITISFKSAEGLEAGKTKIKYKDVEIGLVESIILADDLASVLVTAELVKGSKAYLTDRTRFWVVRARVRAGEISGLGTLLGGAYIAVDPVKDGKRVDTFTGLETPPVVTMDDPGRHYLLRAEKLGSLDAGSPIYYRQIIVGQVESYELDKDGKYVDIRIFINAPHHAYIKKNTRFWNAGGLDFSVDANGLRVDSQSLVSILLGGIAFDNPVDLKQDDVAANNSMYLLFDSRQDAMARTYAIKRYWLLEFKGSVRGLTKGAPVEFRGLQIGKVQDIDLQIRNDDGTDILISVLIEAEPERFMGKEIIEDDVRYRKFINSLVDKGLRAQLKTGNLLTGKLYVDLDFHSNGPLYTIDWETKYPRLPTVPQSFEELVADFKKLLDRFKEVPFEEIGQDLQSVLKKLDSTLLATKSLITQMDSDISPEFQTLLKQATNTLSEIEVSYGNESPLNHKARHALDELADAAESLRLLADYLEQYPDALLRGKGTIGGK
jgi:paraquat-inducible protein B